MLPRQGIEVRFAEDDSPEALAKLIDARTKAVFFESISNPALEVIDIKSVSEIAHAAGALVIVDNVFATPIFSRAVEQGAQAAVMAPTELLAEQHARNFAGWLEPIGVRVGLFTGRLTGRARAALTHAVIWPSNPALEGIRRRFMAASLFSRTTAVLIFTVLMPDLSKAAAASSQRLHTSARKPCPGGSVSVNILSVVAEP